MASFGRSTSYLISQSYLDGFRPITSDDLSKDRHEHGSTHQLEDGTDPVREAQRGLEMVTSRALPHEGFVVSVDDLASTSDDLFLLISDD